MALDSITKSAKFTACLLQAEQWRVGLLAACYAFVLGAWLIRTGLTGGPFGWEYAAGATVLGVAIALLCVGLVDISRRRRRGGDLPWGRLIAGASLDLGVPFAILALLQVRPSTDAVHSLAAPVLLVIPIVIMLSVLRLSPTFAFVTGLSAALGHWALVIAAAALGRVPSTVLSVALSYGVVLALCGGAAAILAVFVRRYIEEAMRQTEAAHLAARSLATYEHELDIARQIQLSLLPSAEPELDAYQIAALSRPATHAGGDYYDWQTLPDGRVVVAVADVTGHGIGPAMVMAVCRAYARATAPTAADPSQMLERLNRLILEDVKGARFITMVVALLDPDGEVELLSAGHGPTFLCRRAGDEIEQFHGDGLPLGVFDEESYAPVRRLRLDRGDTLVLLTDGFMERMAPDGAVFGVGRLQQVIADHAAAEPSELIDAIDRATAEFADGAPQGDDVTAVVIRRR